MALLAGSGNKKQVCLIRLGYASRGLLFYAICGTVNLVVG